MRANDGLFSFPSNLIHSFSLKLFLLAVVLLTVPLILYWQFVRAEREQYGLLRNAAGQTGQVITAMLQPHFEHFHDRSPNDLSEALEGAAIDNTNVKILVRLAGAPPDDFTYVASSPAVSATYIKLEQRKLIQSGILKRLAPTCDKATDLETGFINPAGVQEVLTSMTPVHIGQNCWIVITSQNASALAPTRPNLSFWNSLPMRAAAAIYVLSAALVIWLFAHMWRNVSRFRSAARRIRFRGGGVNSFRELNSIPEMSRVAEDFDSLVEALISSQNLIKQTAEETTHALKAPLAVIAQSIEPLRRAAPLSDAAAQRSLQMIERSVIKLDSLVSSVRDLEQAAADLVYPVLRPINLSAFVLHMLEDYEITMVAQNKHLSARISESVTAYANEDLIEPVVENLLENAASYTPRGGTVEVFLERSGEHAHVTIADRGPGVDANNLLRIFDRYATFRLPSAGIADDVTGTSSHQGLGLWVVKRNVEGLGGSVSARNREGGGFEITVKFRANT